MPSLKNNQHLDSLDHWIWDSSNEPHSVGSKVWEFSTFLQSGILPNYLSPLTNIKIVSHKSCIIVMTKNITYVFMLVCVMNATVTTQTPRLSVSLGVVKEQGPIISVSESLQFKKDLLPLSEEAAPSLKFTSISSSFIQNLSFLYSYFFLSKMSVEMKQKLCFGSYMRNCVSGIYISKRLISCFLPFSGVFLTPCRYWPAKTNYGSCWYAQFWTSQEDFIGTRKYGILQV